MGGIGKSTTVRKFASDNKERFDNLIYIQYKEPITEHQTKDDFGGLCLSILTVL